jgi:hypothetical protein
MVATRTTVKMNRTNKTNKTNKTRISLLREDAEEEEEKPRDTVRTRVRVRINKVERDAEESLIAREDPVENIKFSTIE